MIYVGMDLSSKSFMVHAINEKKREVFRGEIGSSRAGLRALLRDLPDEKKLVAFEAGNQMKWVADELRRVSDVNVHVVHPNEVKWITSSRGKTDKVDARKLAELARGDLLPRPVHIVEGKARELRELGSAREQLKSKRVSLVNTVRGYVKQEGYRLPAKFFTSRDWQEKLAKLKVSAPLKTIIATYLKAIESLAKAEKEITTSILKVKDRRVELLETIPAIGPLTARTLVGALDDVGRFDNRKSVGNYGALTPTIYQSGDVTQLGRINRDGRQEVRGALLQCAHHIPRMKTHAVRPLREFYERIAKKRGKKIAIVALARKLLLVSYGMLKTGTPYDPAKV